MQKNSKIFAWAILAVLVVAAAVTLLCGGSIWARRSVAATF